MNDLGDLSEQLCRFFQSHGDEVAQAFASGETLHRVVNNGQRIELHCQPQRQRWLLGVGCDTSALDGCARARLEEALLRAGHSSRWSLQQVGLSDEASISLVDCDFPRSTAQLTASAVENQMYSLLAQLDGLVCSSPSISISVSSSPCLLRMGTFVPTCSCASEFSAQMRSLDSSRLPGSIAAQELLFDDDLPVRISLHPRSHHWVIEAFSWDAASLDEPLRRCLVSTLLQINGAALRGRQIICSLDTSDRLMLISRWHLDHAASSSALAWLHYTVQQAHRVRAVAAAIAAQDRPFAATVSAGNL